MKKLSKTKQHIEDTIAAISTPLGEGGIGIVRISGSQALAALKKLFAAKNNKVTSFQSHRVYLGKITSKAGTVLDEVLVSVMHGPKTYTKEDMVEINCHGGIEVLKNVLKEILSLETIRLAEPGEFTKRAFLNGRLDLMQAEAVIDIIRAKSEVALQSAARQLMGKPSQELNKIKNNLLEIITPLEAALDFPEDVSSSSQKRILGQINKIEQILAKNLKQLKKIQFIKEGVKIVIVGRTNVGKSTLLNSLVGKERAIVTSIPGTTRDTLEEPFRIEGVPVIITDTAGLRKTADKIEKQGLKRTQNEIKNADIILYVLDISQPSLEDKNIIKEYIKNRDIFFIANKIDLKHRLKTGKLPLGKNKPLFVSAKKELGIVELRETIRNFIVRKKTAVLKEELIVSNIRQEGLIQQTLSSIKKAKEAAENKLSEEFILFDLKNALNALGEITGEVTTDDILDKIFSQFCIGK